MLVSLRFHTGLGAVLFSPKKIILFLVTFLVAFDPSHFRPCTVNSSLVLALQQRQLLPTTGDLCKKERKKQEKQIYFQQTSVMANSSSFLAVPYADCCLGSPSVKPSILAIMWVLTRKLSKLQRLTHWQATLASSTPHWSSQTGCSSR